MFVWGGRMLCEEWQVYQRVYENYQISGYVKYNARMGCLNLADAFGMSINPLTVQSKG